MSVKQAVIDLREQCKSTTLFSVARGSGVSYPVVYRFAKDPGYKIRIDTLEKIENYFSPTVEQVISEFSVVESPGENIQ